MLEEVHEIAANLLFLLAALHVAGVIFETSRGEHGLVRAMITGRRGPADRQS
jgi:cytochrome b